jgi:uncharacterized protein (DUF2126 family)
MSDTPLVSIVIPARNEVRDIAATLDTILAIDYEPKEILVVDDSTDETPDIVVRYAGRGVRLIHREQNRNGCCGARNLGMPSTGLSATVAASLPKRRRLYDCQVRRLEPGCPMGQVHCGGRAGCKGHRSRMERRFLLPQDSGG